uniref:Putative secreted protein n=1 Tax=Ixodes ricinus TaxID=34613 RepID=A0A6B0UNJ4_IXORI
MFFRNCSHPLVPIPLIFLELVQTLPHKATFDAEPVRQLPHALSWGHSFWSQSLAFTNISNSSMYKTTHLEGQNSERAKHNYKAIALQAIPASSAANGKRKRKRRKRSRVQCCHRWASEIR